MNLRILALFALLVAPSCAPEAAFAQTAAQPCPQFFAAGQAPAAPGTVEVCFTGFAVGYSATWREPAWSAEHITVTSAQEGEADARNGAFHPCAELPAADRATPADYDDSGFDRGHMTPAGDRGADKPQTFGMCNMVPQKPNLNRKVWAGIEASLRDLAVSGVELYVVTGPLVPTDAATLHGRVAVPSATWKAVDEVGVGAEAWTCTNTDAPVCVQETVAALAAQIGFDPYPGLAADIKVTPITLPKPTKGA